MEKISENEKQIEALENTNEAYMQKIVDLENQKFESIMKNISDDKINSLIENYTRFGSLDAAYIYSKNEKYLCLVLIYSDWNDKLEVLANHGAYLHNFDGDINLKIYAIPLESIDADFSLLTKKVVYDKKGIFTNHQHKVLSKIPNLNLI